MTEADYYWRSLGFFAVSQPTNELKGGGRNVKKAVKYVIAHQHFKMFEQLIGSLLFATHDHIVQTSFIFKMINFFIKNKKGAFYSDEITMTFLKFGCHGA